MRRFFCFILVAMCSCAACAAEKITNNFENVTNRGKVVIVDSAPVLPALPLEGVKIGIDPGHQQSGNSEREAIAPGSKEMKAKVSSGTRGASTGVYEYVVNLDVSVQLKTVLTELGAQVLMTRETHDVDISNQQRAIMMNEWGADLVLRIHCNGSTDSSDEGAGMYIRNTGAKAEESGLLAQCLLESLCAATGAHRNGVYRRDTYTGLNWSEVPSVLVEMGYMSNRSEDEKLNDPAYQKLLVEGLALGIIDYVNSVNTAR